MLVFKDLDLVIFSSCSYSITLLINEDRQKKKKNMLNGVYV
jgi:hypothetical protein